MDTVPHADETMGTTTRVDVQLACDSAAIPSPLELRRWAVSVLRAQAQSGAVCIRIVDEAESASLNADYRSRQGPTNVLSFPSDFDDPESGVRQIGDLAICAPVVVREASDQGKAQADHWAHLVVHGILHLLGFDHEAAEEAAVMETREIEILGELGIADPYQV